MMLSAIQSAESQMIATVQAATAQLDAVGRSEVTDALTGLHDAAEGARRRLQEAADAAKRTLASLAADLGAIAATLGTPPAQTPPAPAEAALAADTVNELAAFEEPAPPLTKPAHDRMADIREELAIAAIEEQRRFVRDGIDLINGIAGPEEAGIHPLPPDVKETVERFATAAASSGALFPPPPANAYDHDASPPKNGRRKGKAKR